jgi:hypothetical protein
MIVASTIRDALRSGTAALAAAALLAGCATPAPTPGAPASRPPVLTVSRLQSQLEQGEAIGVLIGEIDGSGTVYRLTTQQEDDLRASGMPVALLSRIRETYERAIRKHPELATSDAHWMKIDNYWYGGLPAGWPREWIAPGP